MQIQDKQRLIKVKFLVSSHQLLRNYDLPVIDIL
jgi:hypothetical protein